MCNRGTCPIVSGLIEFYFFCYANAITESFPCYLLKGGRSILDVDKQSAITVAEYKDGLAAVPSSLCSALQVDIY